MGTMGAILRHPEDVYPLFKLKMAARSAEKQIPPQPHWAFCYSMLHNVSRSFALVIQQLGPDLRDAVSPFPSSDFVFSILIFEREEILVSMMEACIFLCLMSSAVTGLGISFFFFFSVKGVEFRAVECGVGVTGDDFYLFLLFSWILRTTIGWLCLEIA